MIPSKRPFCFRRSHNHVLFPILAASSAWLVFPTGCATSTTAAPTPGAAGGTVEAEAIAPEAPSQGPSILEAIDDIHRLVLEGQGPRAEAKYVDFVRGQQSAQNLFLWAWATSNDETAWQRFKDITQKFPKSPLGPIGEARIYGRWKDQARVKIKLEAAAALSSPNDPLICLTRGQNALLEGDYAAATTDFDCVYKARPASLAARESMARVFAGQNKLAEAEAEYQKILASFPDIYAIHKALGEIYNRMNEPAKALAAFARANELNSEDVGLIKRLAVAAEATGDKNGALRHYRRLIDINPKNLEAINKVIDLTHDAKDYEGELKALTRAMELKPDDLDYPLRAAEIYAANGDKDKAAQTYQAIYKLDPNNINAILAMARGSLRNNDKGAAINFYLKALDIDANHSDAKAEYAALRAEFRIASPPLSGDPQTISSKLQGIVQRFYRERVKASPGLKGKISVKLDTAKNGRVNADTLAFTDTVNDEALRLCILGNLLEAKFPPAAVSGNIDFVLSN